MTARPILGSSCARATTAAEMRYRIDRPIRGRRGARIIGLDTGADAIVERISHQPWGHARFFSLAEPVGDVGDGGSESVTLRDADGAVSSLLAELEDADVVIMVATTESRRGGGHHHRCGVHGARDHDRGPGHRRAEHWSAPRWRRFGRTRGC